MTLEEIRSRIDAVDREILDKLNQRMSLSLETRQFKSKTRDPDRETQLLDRIKQETAKYNHLRDTFTEQLFMTIMQESRRLQEIISKEESS